MSYKIGIAITTTPEREEMFSMTMEEWEYFEPEDAIIIAHTDTTHKGVAYSKNQCLKQLYELGCEHIFLADDDCYPLKEGWESPYTRHKEPHLMYQFKLRSKPANDMQELYRDNTVVAYSHTRGAMIYVQRRVLDTVGGFDEAYGPYGFEHTDYTNRIHNAGLTTHRAMDVPDSDRLFYCLDQDHKTKSSLAPMKRRMSLKKNVVLYNDNRNSKAYKEFK